MQLLYNLLTWLLNIMKDHNIEAIKKVKPEDCIKIQYDRAVSLDNICVVECLSNDVIAKKMLVRIHWNNLLPEYEDFIISYNGYCLKNFYLLNSQSSYKDKPATKFKVSKNDQIKVLKDQIEEALKNEEFLKVNDLQNQLNKLI